MKKLFLIIMVIFIGCGGKNVVNNEIDQYKIKHQQKEDTLKRADKEWKELDKE